MKLVEAPGGNPQLDFQLDIALFGEAPAAALVIKAPSATTEISDTRGTLKYHEQLAVHVALPQHGQVTWRQRAEYFSGRGA